MTTLYTWTDANGRVHHCDDDCHNATTPRSDCTCICRGYYHGTARTHLLQRIIQEHGAQITMLAQHTADRDGLKLMIHPAATPKH
jgi:hypothetical protein